MTQLFHLAEDPHELRNLADDAQHAPRVKELLDLLRREQRQYGDALPLSVENPRPARVDVETFFKDASREGR